LQPSFTFSPADSAAASTRAECELKRCGETLRNAQKSCDIKTLFLSLKRVKKSYKKTKQNKTKTRDIKTLFLSLKRVKKSYIKNNKKRVIPERADSAHAI
jgi:hypothetical protein